MFVSDNETLLDRTPPRLDQLDSDSRTNYYENLESNEFLTRKAFNELVNHTFNSLKQNVSLDELKITSLRYLKIVEACDDEIFLKKEFKSHNDIEELLMKYYSFCNFDLIENLIENLGTDKDKENLKKYENCFKKFCFTVYNNRVFSSYIYGRRTVTFKLKHSHTLTGETLGRVRERISSLLSINKACLYFCQIREGCLEFDFLVPDSVCERICKSTTEIRKMMYREGVTFVEIYCPLNKV